VGKKKVLAYFIEVLRFEINVNFSYACYLQINENILQFKFLFKLNKLNLAVYVYPLT